MAAGADVDFRQIAGAFNRVMVAYNKHPYKDLVTAMKGHEKIHHAVLNPTIENIENAYGSLRSIKKLIQGVTPPETLAVIDIPIPAHTSWSTTEIPIPLNTSPAVISADIPLNTSPAGISATIPPNTSPAVIGVDIPLNTSPAVISAHIPSNTAPAIIGADIPLNTSPAVISAGIPLNTAPAVVSADIPKEVPYPKCIGVTIAGSADSYLACPSFNIPLTLGGGGHSESSNEYVIATNIRFIKKKYAQVLQAALGIRKRAAELLFAAIAAAILFIVLCIVSFTNGTPVMYCITAVAAVSLVGLIVAQYMYDQCVREKWSVQFLPERVLFMRKHLGKILCIKSFKDYLPRNIVRPQIVTADIPSNTAPKIATAAIPLNTAPQIATADILLNTAPKIATADIPSNTSPKIATADIQLNTAPKIVDAHVPSNTSPNIVKASIPSDRQPKIATAYIPPEPTCWQRITCRTPRPVE